MDLQSEHGFEIHAGSGSPFEHCGLIFLVYYYQ